MIALLDKAIDRKAPSPQLLELLGKLKLKNGDAQGAAELFSLGREQFPHERVWLKLLAAARLKMDEASTLAPLLEEIANGDANDSLAAKKLAQVSIEAKDFASARRWGMRSLEVTPHDVELHEILAAACTALGDADRAAVARRHAELLRGEGSTGGEGVE